MIRTIALLLYCIYLYFFNQLLLIPALAEFSFYGLLFIPLILLMFWLIPADKRKTMIIYTFLFLLLDQSIENALVKLDMLPFLLAILFIGLFLFPLAKWYGKIGVAAFAAALTIAMGFNLLFPENTIQALPHFYKKWNSEKVYIGEMASSFPIAAKDLDGDGKDEIITLGNADEVLKKRGSEKKKLPTYVMQKEQLALYAWKWTSDGMIRIPANQLDPASILASLPIEYTAFPYYTVNDQLELVPLVQRQELTEGMLQFGTSPYRALLLNVENIENQLNRTGDSLDQRDQAGMKFTNLQLKNGILTGSYEGTPFQAPSDATKIVGAIQMGNEKEGLLLLGMDLHLLQFVNGKLTVTHELTRDMQKGLAQSQFKMADLNGDGKDELIIKYPYSTVLAPQAGGTWNILWSTEERSFRFEDFDDKTHEFAGLSKSAVRAKDTGYLTGFKYTGQTLQQSWKVFLTMNDVIFADIDGNGENELISTIYGTDKVYVWEKHQVPVTYILIGITLGLLIYLIGRRIFHANKAV